MPLLVREIQLHFPSPSTSDVTVERQLRQSLDRAAGQRPLHFQPVDLRSLANSEDDPRIMRRQIASTSNFHPATPEISCLIGNAGTDGIAICLLAITVVVRIHAGYSSSRLIPGLPQIGSSYS